MDRDSTRQSLRVATGVGDLFVTATDAYIVRVRWITRDETGFAAEPPSPLLAEAARQLQAYGAARLRNFDLPVRAEGSPFQQSVWQQMQTIPYGETRTYGDLAATLNSSARAVGRGCGANPVPIIIPCHRVMGQKGRLTGFSGGNGVDTKAALLRLERRHAKPAPDLPLFASQAE